MQSFEDQFDVSRETMDRLQAFEHMLVKWNRSINLVAPSTIETLWQRHILDSAQLIKHVDYEVAHWADFGSGGGLPGLIVAILLKEKSPNTRVSLVESDKRKSSFLLTVGKTLDLNTSVIPKRILDVPSLNADIISARALAPLTNLLEFSFFHGQESAISLFPKGKLHKEEIETARKYWGFELETFASITDSDAAILKIKRISNG